MYSAVLDCILYVESCVRLYIVCTELCYTVYCMYRAVLDCIFYVQSCVRLYIVCTELC